MKLFKHILFSLLLLVSSVGYSQNQVISDGSGNLIKVGNNLLTWTYDVSAKIFFDTIEARGGSLTATEKFAVNNYVIALKHGGVWVLTHADYPMVGGTVISCAVNLRNPGTFDLTFVNTVSGDFTANGWTPNGSTSYARMGLIPSVDLTIQSVAMEYYAREEISEGLFNIGALVGVNQRLMLAIRHVNRFIFQNYNSTAGQGLLENATVLSIGGSMASRVANNDCRAFRKGVQIGVTLATSGGSQPNIELYLGCYNNAGSPAALSTRQCAGAGIYDGLTPALVLIQYMARQAKNTTLSREVN